MAIVIGAFRLVYRVPWFILHVVVGTPVAVLCQNSAGRAIRFGGRSLSEVMLTWWAGMICRIFGLQRRISGELQPGAQVIAANHISWIDIQLLHSVAAVGFVAKAEISEWPLVGWLAHLGDTVFHLRGSHDSSSGAVAAMVERLEAGAKVAIFPEGGILPGEGIKRFHARMFGAAINTGAPVQPVMFRYSRGGQICEDITFRPDEHFMANFFRLLMQKPCVAEVRLLPWVPSGGKQRRQLAEEAEAAVRAAYAAELPGA
jgi:1-acyl-sn-glycerol-3-phosphate acyltransferase